MPRYLGCCRLLLTLVCVVASVNVQAQPQLPPLGQQARAAQQNTRLYSVSLAESKYAILFNGLRSVFSAPGVLSQPDPRQLRIQVAGASADIQFADNGGVIIAGEEKLAGQLQQLIQLIDKVDQAGGVRVLRLNSRGRVALSQFSMQPASPQSPAPFRQASFATPVTPQEGATSMPQQGSSIEGNPIKQKTKLALPQFGEVDVDILPEIDAIIIRGREKQLGELAEIIRRLDAASREAQPQIELIPLKHVQARAIGTVVQEQVQDLTGLRQGTVSITPISTPNALLLVGWGESMTLIKNLIARLDTPVHPDNGFVVIPLTHTTAEQATTQLQAFFTSRGGSVPSVQADARTNSLIVHSSSNDLAQIRRLLESIDSPRTKSMQQAKVFPIRHSLAADVAQALEQAIAPPGTGTSMQLLDEAGKPLATSGVLGQSSITVNERNNTLIVSTAPENLELIARLISQIDAPGRIASIKIFPVLNGNAASMVETLRALIPSQSGSSISPQLSSAPGESSLLPLRFTVDARGNNVIAIGSDGDLRIVEALVERLDESDTMQRKNRVYQLKNSPAVDVALAVNEFLRSKRLVEQAGPGQENPFEQIEKEVVVVPEAVQNKLILSATPRYFDEILDLIEQLDQQPPQVMIQVLIAEIALGNTDEFGVELGLQNSVLFDRSLLGDLVTRTTTTNTSTPAGVVTQTVEDIVAASNLPGFLFNSPNGLGNSGSSAALASSGQVGNQGVSNFSVGRTNSELGFGGLVLSASSENVSFLLRALQDSRRLEVLSRPQVLTLDNQQAFIQVGQRVPRIVNSIINQNGAQNNVELENVGLIIGVTPRISPDGNVVMEIDAEKSSLGPEADGIPVSIASDGTVIRSPRVDTITAQATVSAADGETIILGGLISRSTRTNHRSVPILGQIPLLRNLFRYDLFNQDRSELVIIMTPHVVRTQTDMERLKQAEFARMSWCEADIFDLHGDIRGSADVYSMTIPDLENSTEPTEVIYPDLNPRGTVSPPVRMAPKFNPQQPGDAASIRESSPLPLPPQRRSASGVGYAAPIQNDSTPARNADPVQPASATTPVNVPFAPQTQFPPLPQVPPQYGASMGQGDN